MARDTHERMLRAASSLLQSRGFHGTALNDVLDVSGAPRGSLYFHFPEGKAQLVLEATRRGVEEVTAARSAAVAASASAADAVRAIAAAIAESVLKTNYQGGCPIAPLVMDGRLKSEGVEALCRETFEDWTEKLKEGLVAGGVPASEAHGLAILALSTFQGSLVLARAARDVAPIHIAAEQVAKIVARAAAAGEAPES